MRLLRRTSFLFLLVSAPLCVTAQESIAVQVISDTVLVPVRIHDRDLAFLLDTGSEASSIDTTVATELGFKSLGTEQILKNFRNLTVDFTEAESLRIGKSIFSHVKLAEITLAPLSQALGTTVDGVLGNDILQGLTFKLSYSNQQLLVGPLPSLGSLGQSVPLRRSDGQFLVPVSFVSTPGTFVFDTGTNSTDLGWKTWELVKRTWTPRELIEGVLRAGNPTSPAMLVCLPTVQLGNTTLKDQVVRAQTKSDAGAFSSEDFSGILGSDILRQFEITFDLKHDRVFFQRDENYQPDPYHYVTIGIQIAKDARNGILVMSVWKDSPAAEAGIRPGDYLEAVNGQPVKSLTPAQVSGKFHAEEGTTVRLTVARNSELSTVTVQTRRLLCLGRRP